MSLSIVEDRDSYTKSECDCEVCYSMNFAKQLQKPTKKYGVYYRLFHVVNRLEERYQDEIIMDHEIGKKK